MPQASPGALVGRPRTFGARPGDRDCCERPLVRTPQETADRSTNYGAARHQRRNRRKTGKPPPEGGELHNIKGELATHVTRGRLANKPGREQQRTRLQDWRAAIAGSRSLPMRPAGLKPPMYSFYKCYLNSLNVHPLRAKQTNVVKIIKFKCIVILNLINDGGVAEVMRKQFPRRRRFKTGKKKKKEKG